MPPRQPDYRLERDHHDFLTNLDAGADQLRQLLVEQWQPTEACGDWPQERTGQLVASRYCQSGWNS